jgi:uncharacterized membrane protein YfcA
MNGWELVIFGLAGLVMSVLSGIAGAGGGFVMTPLGIFLGLSPAQSVSTGKFVGLSITIGSLIGMKQAHGRISRAKTIPVMILAFLVGLGVPYVIKTLDGDVYKIALGIILLLMIPIMVVKKVGINARKPKTWQRVLGGGLLTLALILQGIFSGGLGTLVNVVLMGMLGMTAIEANLTKRWSQLILNVTIILGVIGAGLIAWPVVAVGVCSTFVGSLLGGKMAINKGDTFTMRIMVVVMLVSAIGLIIDAI